MGFLSFALSMLAAGFSFSQQQNSRLEPVDPGVADTGPLSVSERLMPTDLRVPAAFERVYRLTGKNGGRFARVNGAITAVFPRSHYVLTEAGEIPEIPSGTVFYIGGLPKEDPFAPEQLARRATNYVDTSAKDAVPVGVVPSGYARAQPARGSAYSAAPARRADSLFTDDLYRRMRVADLLDRAVGGSEAP